MSHLPQDPQNNLVSFLRHHRPQPPVAQPNLENQLIASLEAENHSSFRRKKNYFQTTWTLSSAIATGLLFTSVSFSLKTPRLALEPKDVENFLVGNWQNTLSTDSPLESAEAYWLLPVEPAVTVSISAP